MGQHDPRSAQCADCGATLSGGLTPRLKTCEAICCRDSKVLTAFASFCRQMQDKLTFFCPLLP